MKIVICGNYGATNIGDELILKNLLQALKRILPDASVTVMSNDPKSIERLHHVLSVPHFPFGIRSFVRGCFTGSWKKTWHAVKTCDLFILGGGGLFTDEKFPAVPMWFYQTSFARFFRKPIAIFGVSVGPLNKKFAQKLVRKIASWAEFISVRDKRSFAILHSLMPHKKIVHGADLVFSETEIRKQFMIPEVKPRYVAIVLRPWISHMSELIKKIDQFTSWLYWEYRLETVLVPFQKLVDDDEKFMRRFANKNFVHLCRYADNFEEIFSIFSHAEAVISMRLHGIILAAIAHTPFIAIDYSQKVSGIIEMLEMNDFSVALGDVPGDELEAKFKKMMEEREAIKEKLKLTVDRLNKEGKFAEEEFRNFALTLRRPKV